MAWCEKIGKYTGHLNVGTMLLIQLGAIYLSLQLLIRQNLYTYIHAYIYGLTLNEDLLCSTYCIYCKSKDTALGEKQRNITMCTSLDIVKCQFHCYKLGIIVVLLPNSQGHWKDQLRQWMWKYLGTAKLLLLCICTFGLLTFWTFFQLTV